MKCNCPLREILGRQGAVKLKVVVMPGAGANKLTDY